MTGVAYVRATKSLLITLFCVSPLHQTWHFVFTLSDFLGHAKDSNLVAGMLARKVQWL